MDPSLVPDCLLRTGVEDYLGAAVAGELGASQRRFVTENRAVLTRILDKIWPALGHSPAVRDDGAFNQEKWGILKFAAIPQQDLAKMLRQSLASEGVTGGLVDFVLEHPVSGIEAELERTVRREESASTKRDRSFATEIYALALLHSIGRRDIAARLEDLGRDDRTNQLERRVLSAILSRIRANERIRWIDLEPLESEP